MFNLTRAGRIAAQAKLAEITQAERLAYAKSISKMRSVAAQAATLATEMLNTTDAKAAMIAWKARRALLDELPKLKSLADDLAKDLPAGAVNETHALDAFL